MLYKSEQAQMLTCEVSTLNSLYQHTGTTSRKSPGLTTEMMQDWNHASATRQPVRIIKQHHHLKHKNKQEKFVYNELNLYKSPTPVRVNLLHSVNELVISLRQPLANTRMYMCVHVWVRVLMWSVRSASEATVQKDCSHKQNGGQSEREGPRDKPSSERNQEHWQCSGHGAVIAIFWSIDSSSFWAATIAVWTQQNKLQLIPDICDWRFL